jgi:membrane associated rhomboid family serine protease
VAKNSLVIARGGVGNARTLRKRPFDPAEGACAFRFFVWNVFRASKFFGGAPSLSLRALRKAAYLGVSTLLSGIPVLLSPPNSDQKPAREPILTIPGAMTALLVVMAAIHGVRALLPLETDEDVIWTFGFVPARYDASLTPGIIPGGAGADVWTFLTYAFLHADLNHIVFNMLWMLPFGSALARRFGAVRFFVFLGITAVGGAVAHLLTHQQETAPMIGASAAVSGAMAACIRFAFQSGSFLSFRRGDAELAAHVPALSLWRSLQNSRVLGFLAIWFGINIVFGLGSVAVGATTQSVAWQAHIGGFLAGLLLFSWFDPVLRAILQDNQAGAPPPDGHDVR